MQMRVLHVSGYVPYISQYSHCNVLGHPWFGSASIIPMWHQDGMIPHEHGVKDVW